MRKLAVLVGSTMLLAMTALSTPIAAQTYMMREKLAPGALPPVYDGAWSQKSSVGGCVDGRIVTSYPTTCSGGACDPVKRPADRASTSTMCTVYRKCTASAGRAATGGTPVRMADTCFLSTAIDECSKVPNAIACSIEFNRTLYGCDVYKATALTGQPGAATVAPTSTPDLFGGVCS